MQPLPPSPPGRPRTAMTTPFALAAAVTIVAGLWLDAEAHVWAQPFVNVWTWTLLTLLCVRATPEQRRQWLICLAWAAFGECVLSLLWGIYDYRLGNLPLFVPPGHVLLFALGVWLNGRLPHGFAAALPPVLVGLVPTWSLMTGDTASLPLFALYLLALRFGPSPALYSTMFVLALAMELYGTALGNWAWHPDVPGLPLRATNPPLAAGAFYCVLDWLTGIGQGGRGTDRPGATAREPT